MPTVQSLIGYLQQFDPELPVACREADVNENVEHLSLDTLTDEVLDAERGTAAYAVVYGEVTEEDTEEITNRVGGNAGDMTLEALSTGLLRISGPYESRDAARRGGVGGVVGIVQLYQTPANTSPVQHPFRRDGSGLTCRVCHLPKANVRHH